MAAATSTTSTTAHPRVLVLPFPAQGHVIPLMELSHKLAGHGLEVHFVNTEFNHDRVLEAMAADESGGSSAGAIPDGIHMLSVPDGLGPADDHTDIGGLVKGLPAAMAGHLEEAIRARRIGWMVADVSMSWALELASTVGVRVALFSTYSAAAFALRMNLPKLIEDGVLDETGDVKNHGRVQVTPPVDAAEIPWVSLGTTPERRRINIQKVLTTNRSIHLAETIVFNTSREMEPDALALVPNALAVGPLEAPASTGRGAGAGGHFLPEDVACLAWLDARPRGSVVYVAFGSSAFLGAAAFRELADGLALSRRPFLWVVRPNCLAAAGAGEEWLAAFRRRVEGRGLVVAGWAPQRRVLSHPAVACFVSHCGWNSTADGVLRGVPFLCWPYFADQFCNQSYVCNVWKTGVKLPRDERGVVTKEEIKSKVAQLVGDECIRARAVALKNAAQESIREGGSSHQSFLKLVNLLKEQE